MSQPTTIDPEFAALLCCPLCEKRPKLTLLTDGSGLSCPCERRALFPFVEGLPDLRPESARFETDTGATTPEAQPPH